MTYLVIYQTPTILQKQITANNLQQAMYKAALDGCNMDKNMRLITTSLMLDNPPANLISQFKLPKNGTYEAKKNSEINKKWLELVEELGLEWYGTVEFLANIGLLGGRNKIHTLYPEMYGDYYFDSNKGDWENIEWADEVNETEFLRLRADWLDKENPELLSNV